MSDIEKRLENLENTVLYLAGHVGRLDTPEVKLELVKYQMKIAKLRGDEPQGDPAE